MMETPIGVETRSKAKVEVFVNIIPPFNFCSVFSQSSTAFRHFFFSLTIARLVDVVDL